MLSRVDIEQELGKGINIFPLNLDNIKENSVNFTASKYAWTMGSGYIRNLGNGKFEMSPNREGASFRLNKGSRCYKDTHLGVETAHYILLLPHVPTIIETNEVLAVDNYIGGAVHSRVGIVTRGIGDLGTMLGPNFCGHLMITLQNNTDNIIALPENASIASLTFDYLKTPIKGNVNATISGHIDKFSELGIKINSAERNYLTADWKGNLDGVRDKMKESEAYKKLQSKLKAARWKKLREFFSWSNLFPYLIILSVFVIAYALSCLADFWETQMFGVIDSPM